jgi:hypothetical protein
MNINGVTGATGPDHEYAPSGAFKIEGFHA